MSESIDTARWRARAPLLPEGGRDAVLTLCDEIDGLSARVSELEVQDERHALDGNTAMHELSKAWSEMPGGGVSPPHGWMADGSTLATRVRDLKIEIDSLRALLDAPMPCRWPAPEVKAYPDGFVGVDWAALEGPYPGTMDPDTVIGLGAALIRVALEVKALQEAKRRG